MRKRTKVVLICAGVFVGMVILGSLLPDTEIPETATSGQAGSSSSANVGAANPDAGGFKNMDDWARAQCGDKDFVEDFTKLYWENQGYLPKRISGVNRGWTMEESAEADGRITNDDFPRFYVFTAGRVQKNAFGQRPLIQHTVVYNYDCSIREQKTFDRGFD